MGEPCRGNGGSAGKMTGRRLTPSLRVIMSLSGLVFTACAGILAWYITWTVSVDQIDRIAESLRETAISLVASRVLSVTNGVQQLSVRNAQGLHGVSAFGCCSTSSHDAKHLREFAGVRLLHWSNIVSNPNILVSYSATATGALLLVYRSKNMEFVDATAARNGAGNMRWTISDQSTSFVQHWYLANSWKDGRFELAQTALCGAGYHGVVDEMLTANVETREECRDAAAQLGWPLRDVANDSAPTCYVVDGSAEVLWNPSGRPVEHDTRHRAICRQGHWAREKELFRPNCTHGYPCTSGDWVPTHDPLFNDSHHTALTTVYNATGRSWFRRAVENGNPDGEHCRRFGGSDCRRKPSWAPIYLSINAQELVLPSVFAFFVGETDEVRAVLALGIGLRFLDGVMEEEVRRIAPEAAGWIVDLHEGNPGTLLASTPAGLSSAQSIATYAVNASGDGATWSNPVGEEVAQFSRQFLLRYGDDDDDPTATTSQKYWRDVPKTAQFSHAGRLVQAVWLVDDYGLEWLIALSVTNDVFMGDLPKARDTTIGIVCGLTLALAGVLFGITQLVSLDLMKLGSDMELCARMLLDQVNVHRGRSCLAEVYWMEDSFFKMHRNLGQYRAFLPQSCLWTGEECRDEVLSIDTVTKDSIAERAVSEPQETSQVIGSGRASPQLSFHAPMMRVQSGLSRHSSEGPRESDTLSRHGSLRQEPKPKRVSLLVVNRKGFVHLYKQGSQSILSEWFSNSVARFSEVVMMHKGVVDLISADHFFASFNTVRGCAMHRLNAVQCATLAQPQGSGMVPTRDMPITAAVVSNTAMCGDFGSASMVRHMVIGDVSSLLHILERVAADWRVLLIDGLVHNDVSNHFTCRLRSLASYQKTKSTVSLWQVTGERARRPSDGPEEWMYELSNTIKDKWDELNAAMQKWAAGDRDTARTVLLTAEESSCEEVRAAAAVLVTRIESGSSATLELHEAGASERRSGGRHSIAVTGDIPTPRQVKCHAQFSEPSRSDSPT